MDESLREAACLGNLLSLQKLLRSGANINSKNSMNGWYVSVENYCFSISNSHAHM